MLELRFNPFLVFKESKSPAGLYARKRWLGEADTLLWKKDFNDTKNSLMAEQTADGSWNASTLESIIRLFGLHLTVRNPTEEIQRALNWLIHNALHRASTDNLCSGSVVHPHELNDLPFTSGQTHLLETCATLFLATIFGRGYEPLIMSHYRTIAGLIADYQEYLFPNWSDTNNILRALVVHPQFSESEATAILVEYLGKLQNQEGFWPSQVPFYQTFNALAHLTTALSGEQLRKAVMALYNSQNEEGTWGREDREWNTFLTVHALKNMGCLLNGKG
jgi:hypothetical protein